MCFAQENITSLGFLHFCRSVRSFGEPVFSSFTIGNMYIEKTKGTVFSFHSL